MLTTTTTLATSTSTTASHFVRAQQRTKQSQVGVLLTKADVINDRTAERQARRAQAHGQVVRNLHQQVPRQGVLPAPFGFLRQWGNRGHSHLKNDKSYDEANQAENVAVGVVFVVS